MGVMTGVPTCFRARCLEASHDYRAGYWGAGHLLASHMGAYLEGESDDERATKLEELSDLIGVSTEEERDALVWAWFRREFPACMKLVPTKRRDTFLAGVYQVNIETGISI